MTKREFCSTVNMRAAHVQIVHTLNPCPSCASLDTVPSGTPMFDGVRAFACCVCRYEWLARPYVPRPALIHQDENGIPVPYLHPRPVADPKSGDMTRGGPHAYRHLCLYQPLPNSFWSVCVVCSRLRSGSDEEPCQP